MSPTEEYDVVIVGAGPAGSSCAIRLARNGLKVLLTEQKRFPRPKLCGEFISPECLVHFGELGILDSILLSGGVDIERTIFYARSGRSLTVPTRWLSVDTKALGLSRSQMDEVLLSSAAGAGAEIMQETTVTGLLQTNDRVTRVELRCKSGEPYAVKSKLVIDATGRSRSLSRFVSGQRGKRAAFVAFKTHLSGAAVPPGDCEIYSYKDGYGGCSGIENNMHNLCFIIDAAIARQYSSDAEQVMRKVLFTNKRAESSLRNATIVDPWLAVPIESYGRSDISPARGVLAIGDAAGFIDPFTGSGILLALETSRIAAEILASEPASLAPESFPALMREYQRRYRSSFDRRIGVTSLVRRVAFIPVLAGGIINLLALSRRLTRRITARTRA